MASFPFFGLWWSPAGKLAEEIGHAQGSKVTMA